MPTIETPTDNPEPTAPTHAIIYFSRKRNQWESTDGTPVCQDHATLQPCPHHNLAEHGRW